MVISNGVEENDEEEPKLIVYPFCSYCKKPNISQTIEVNDNYDKKEELLLE